RPAAGRGGLGEAPTAAGSLALAKPVWRVAVQGAPSKSRGGAVTAYVILPGGLDLGLELVKRGDAAVRTSRSPFKQRAAYLRAQQAAQASSLGLWGCTSGQATTTTTTPAPPGQGQGTSQGKPQGQGRWHSGDDGSAPGGSIPGGSGQGSSGQDSPRQGSGGAKK